MLKEQIYVLHKYNIGWGGGGGFPPPPPRPLAMTILVEFRCFWVLFLRTFTLAVKRIPALWSIPFLASVPSWRLWYQHVVSRRSTTTTYYVVLQSSKLSLLLVVASQVYMKRNRHTHSKQLVFNYSRIDFHKNKSQLIQLADERREIKILRRILG